MAARSSSSRERPSLRSKRDNSYEATLVFSEHASIIYHALAPEGENVKRLRSTYVLNMSNNKLSIKITSLDFTAFKATMNSILKCSELAVKVTHG